MSKAIYWAAAAGAVAGFSAIALKFLSIPFLWIGLTWAIAGFAVAALAPQLVKLSITLAAALPLAIGLGELTVWITSPPEVIYYDDPSPNEEDAVLGWRLKPSQVSHATADVSGIRIYDVSYSTDATGHRISPPDRGLQIQGCMLFLSDSFTFGKGVGDHDAFPYQVGLKTHGRLRIVNLAVPAYGAEQMLASIERGKLATDPPCEPTHIIYAALPHHILRAAGKTDFSRRGPRYRLRADGVPEYLGTNLSEAGTTSESWIWLHGRLVEQLNKSQIYRMLGKRPPPTTEADIDLYFGIVRQAVRLFEQRWPNAEFHLISWDVQDFYSNGQTRFHEGLQGIGPKVHFIDDILPGYTKEPTKYGLHQFDLHPNSLAHEILAAYLAERVVSRATTKLGSDP